MKLNRTDAFWDRSTRNGINENWDIIEGTTKKLEGDYRNVVSNITDEVVGQLVDSAKLIWKEPVDTYNDLPFNPPANPEIGETRMVRDTGKVYRFDGAQWIEIQEYDATAINEVDSRLTEQLGEEAKSRIGVDDRAFYEGVKFNRRHKAIMTIVDDDAYPQVYSLLLPIVRQEKVPITIAAITGRVGTSPLSMNLDQLKECQAAGMDVQSHTVNHKPLATLTYEEKEFEIRESRKWLQENGFSSDVLVYPFGSVDAEVYELTNLYYSAGVYIDGDLSLLNNPPIRREKLERVYYNLTDPVTQEDKNRVQLCKDKIDEAVANNSWIIIGVHCFYEGFDPEGLREVIRYAKSQGVEIVSMKKGLELYDNIIDLPEFQVGANGRISSYILGKMQRLPTVPTSSTPVTDFPQDAFSYRWYNISAATSSGMPEGRAGVLVTFRGPSDDYAYQFYHFTALDQSYRRRWDNTNKVWTPFVRVAPRTYTKTSNFAMGTIPAGATVDFEEPNSAAFGFSKIGNVNPATPLPRGIMYCFFTKADRIGVVRVHNTTNEAINLGNVSWNYVTIEA